MKRIAAMLLVSVLLLSCVGCAQDGRKEPDSEKADLGLTAEVKPATDFTAKANAAVYDELDFDDKQEYEFATRGLIDAPETSPDISDIIKITIIQRTQSAHAAAFFIPPTLSLLSSVGIIIAQGGGKRKPRKPFCRAKIRCAPKLAKNA